MRSPLWPLAVALALLTLPRPASADFINGGFESGLTGWQSTGDALAVGAGFGTDPAAGSSQGLVTTASNNGDFNNFSGFDAVSATALETFLELANGTLGAGFEGSAIRQTFTAEAGDVLSFRWNFLTTEGSAADFAFVTLSGAGLTVLADTTSSLLGPSGVVLDPVFGDPTRETGYRTFSLTVAAAGTYTLGFGVADHTDEFIPSALLIDGVSLQSAGDVSVVPAPATLTSLLIGGAVIAGYRLRSARREFLRPQ
jgi:hypothetical protein